MTNQQKLQTPLEALDEADPFHVAQKEGVYIFTYDHYNNVIEVSGKLANAEDIANRKNEDKRPEMPEEITGYSMLNPGAVNDRIIGGADAPADQGGDHNNDLMVFSPDYFIQKHIYTDRSQRVAQVTDTAPGQNAMAG